MEQKRKMTVRRRFSSLYVSELSKGSQNIGKLLEK